LVAIYEYKFDGRLPVDAPRCIYIQKKTFKFLNSLLQIAIVQDNNSFFC